MDTQDDDLKPFGDGFDGFPKRLPEDCVEYSLYIIDDKLNKKEILSRLEAVRKESLKRSESLLKDYIWQREPFKLEIESGKGLMYLHGLTNYGDSVEDEWLIVYMLRELSNRFPDLWIKVVDTDGEFLLIEAANALPEWLNPEIADNRVWLHHGKLCIIPLTATTPSTSANKTTAISRSLSLEEAHKNITFTPKILTNSLLIEEEAFYRLRNYPGQIAASIHHALITVPRKLASLIHDRPQSIAPATEAFYLRDPIAMKPLQTNTSLTFPPQDLVTLSVRFTKVLYAQLKSQQFESPPAWKNILAQASKDSGEISKTYMRLEMGMKVTSGYEILVTDSKNNDSRIVREAKILLEDMATATENVLPTDDEISKWKDTTREDSESWLDINFEDFEKELQGKNNKGENDKNMPTHSGTFGPEPPSGFGDAKTQADLKKMVERFESFLNDDEAGIDGAEIDDMDVDDDDEEDSSEDEDKEVSFDENEFARMMREMMGMPPSENSDSTEAETQRVEEIDSSDSDDNIEGLSEARKIRKVMQMMEVELNEAGALNLDPAPRKLSALKGKGKAGEGDDEEEKEEEDSDGDVDIDLNLAKNILESFKSQGGAAGPGGNMLAMLGLHLPRDEDDGKGKKL